jgi:hypothetical protein
MPSSATDLLKKTPHEILFEIDRGGRFVIYQYVISLVVVTFRRNSPIQFVPASESAALKSMQWTALTFLLGWWGFPFGFIYTPMVLYRNLKGGTDVTHAIRARLEPVAPVSFQKAQPVSI